VYSGGRGWAYPPPENKDLVRQREKDSRVEIINKEYLREKQTLYKVTELIYTVEVLHSSDRSMYVNKWLEIILSVLVQSITRAPATEYNKIKTWGII